MTEATTDGCAPLGWWVLDGADLLAMLHRVAAGENPGVVYAEGYANARREDVR